MNLSKHGHNSYLGAARAARKPLNVARYASGLHLFGTDVFFQSMESKLTKL